jgi:putative flippase GtrA
MQQVNPLRHYGGFLVAGLLALTTDGAILQTLTKLGWDPLAARLIAIAIAMVVSWLINRTVTFAMKGPPSLREYARFATVSWSSQVVNYGLFSIIMLARPETHVLIALFIASFFAMFVSYFGYRYGVFSHPPTAAWDNSPDQTHGS